MKGTMYILRYLRQADYKRLMMCTFKMCIVSMPFLLYGLFFLLPLGFLFCMLIDYNIELLNRISVFCGFNWKCFPHIAEFWLPEEGTSGVVQVICLDSIYIICYLLEEVERPRNRMLSWLKRILSED